MNQKVDIRVVSLVLVLVTVLMRLVPHAYNMAPMGALAIFIGCYWSGYVGAILTLAAMVLSDVLGQWFSIPSMGFYEFPMMATVYLAMASSAFFGAWARNRTTPVNILAISIGSAVWFFLATNFACWLSPLMNYERSLSGLMSCYVMGLPFLIKSILGNIVFSAVYFGAYEALLRPVGSVSARTN